MTKRIGIPLTAALGGVALVLVGCGDHSPLGIGSPKRELQADLLATSTLLIDSVAQKAAGLLTCPPLPYDSVTQEVDSAGGVFQIGDHTLSIPPGALSAPVSITAVAPSDSVRRVEFSPEGLAFAEPADLTLSYAGCGAVDGPKRIAYVDDAFQILEYLPSADSGQSQLVTGRLQHFSGYAVAW